MTPVPKEHKPRTRERRQPRSLVENFRITPDERRALAKVARKARRKRSAYARDAVLEKVRADAAL